MKKINWGYVLTLVSSRDFVRDVEDFFGRIKSTENDLEILLYWGADTLRNEIDMKQSFNNNFIDIRKSVLIARDIIKMNNFKRVTWNSRFFKYIVDRNKSYPRITKDDVYERDIVAEKLEQERRWSCCMPYDCMCYENVSSIGQIWTKVNQESRVG
tara:strand:- start:273 stop:740 length:468 start_codon:yes stop_codon:yes gene_type:complete